MVCVVPISNAILWTHFVTPHADQTQQDQTKQVSYYKKGKYEELGCLEDISSGPSLVGLVHFCFGIDLNKHVSRGGSWQWEKCEQTKVGLSNSVTLQLVTNLKAS
jgi:hypothetical protein